jgi:GrpB-like predicted nucleotidyltransferase (UPF0157 family)
LTSFLIILNGRVFFKEEALKIKQALGGNCLDVHHVGSTSVPGLSAKPIIDIIGVMKDPKKAILPLESLGFTYKGEYNIPFSPLFQQKKKHKSSPSCL